MPRPKILIIAAVFQLCLAVEPALATPLLVSQGGAGWGGYGDSQWQNMSAALDTGAGGQVTVVPELSDVSQMMEFTAIWVDLRGGPGVRLSDSEIQNLRQFVATGRRLVMIGEHQDFRTWNDDLLRVVDAFSLPGTSTTRPARPVLHHYLTSGLFDIAVPMAGVAIGGTSLFDENFATLWGPSNNVLTVLDSNVFSDLYWSVQDNSAFAQNVARWITFGDAPTISLEVNGYHPPSRVVPTSGPAHLTIGVSAGDWTDPVEWYWAVILNGSVYWITSQGVASAPAPLVTQVPTTLPDVTLFEWNLPPGTTLTNVLFMRAPFGVIASDWITVVRQ